MANSKALVIYILFFTFFSFFVGLFALEQQNKSIADFRFMDTVYNALNKNESFFTSVLKVILIPFLVIEALYLILALIGVSFVTLPPVITLLVLTPMGIIITIDYVIPVIRGN